MVMKHKKKRFYLLRGALGNIGCINYLSRASLHIPSYKLASIYSLLQCQYAQGKLDYSKYIKKNSSLN